MSTSSRSGRRSWRTTTTTVVRIFLRSSTRLLPPSATHATTTLTMPCLTRTVTSVSVCSLAPASSHTQSMYRKLPEHSQVATTLVQTIERPKQDCQLAQAVGTRDVRMTGNIPVRSVNADIRTPNLGSRNALRVKTGNRVNITGTPSSPTSAGGQQHRPAGMRPVPREPAAHALTSPSRSQSKIQQPGFQATSEAVN